MINNYPILLYIFRISELIRIEDKVSFGKIFSKKIYKI